MRGWDGLVSSALLGTERRPPHFEELPEPIQERLGEGGLLDAAALATVYKRAGRKPLAELEPLPAAPGEDRPLPRPVAIRRLAAMLSGFQTAALGEWLRAADAKGWGVPPEHLPALADYARGRAEYRPLVVAAAGRRASWLAELNPEWRFLHEAVARAMIRSSGRMATRSSAGAGCARSASRTRRRARGTRRGLADRVGRDPGRVPRLAGRSDCPRPTRSSSRRRSTTAPRTSAGSRPSCSPGSPVRSTADGWRTECGRI